MCLSESMCSVQWDKGVWVGRWVWLLWLPPAHNCVLVCVYIVCLFTCVYCKCIIGHVVCVQVCVSMLHQCSVCVLVHEYNCTSGHESALIYLLCVVSLTLHHIKVCTHRRIQLWSLTTDCCLLRLQTFLELSSAN